MKLTDQLRLAIKNSGLSRYRIAKETGISESTLSKFHRGKRGLSMEAMNALGERLGLRIVIDDQPNRATHLPNGTTHLVEPNGEES